MQPAHARHRCITRPFSLHRACLPRPQSSQTWLRRTAACPIPQSAAEGRARVDECRHDDCEAGCRSMHDWRAHSMNSVALHTMAQRSNCCTHVHHFLHLHWLVYHAPAQEQDRAAVFSRGRSRRLRRCHGMRCLLPCRDPASRDHLLPLRSQHNSAQDGEPSGVHMVHGVQQEADEHHARHVGYGTKSNEGRWQGSGGAIECACHSLHATVNYPSPESNAHRRHSPHLAKSGQSRIR